MRTRIATVLALLTLAGALASTALLLRAPASEPRVSQLPEATATAERTPTVAPSPPASATPGRLGTSQAHLATVSAAAVAAATARAGATPRVFPTATPIPTTAPVDTTPAEGRWVVMLARKQEGETSVLVEEVSFPSQTVKPVFHYEEGTKAGNTGNGWQGLPANASLSRDGRFLAYADRGGLSVYDLAERQRRPLLSRGTTPPDSELFPVVQPIPSPNPGNAVGVLGLYIPRWSADGAYVSVAASYYEGTGQVFVRVSDGVAVAHGWGDPRTLRWAPSGARTLAADHFYIEPDQWLTLRESPDFSPHYLLGRPVPIVQDYPNGFPTPGPLPRLVSVAWSPSGESAAIIGAPPAPPGVSAEYGMGLIDLTTGTIDWLFRLPDLSWEGYLVGGLPAFDPTGRTLVYISSPASADLWVWDFNSGKGRLLAEAPAGFFRAEPLTWISDTLLACQVHSSGGSLNGTAHSQVLLIDIATGEVRPITGLLPPYTSVLSVERLP